MLNTLLTISPLFLIIFGAALIQKIKNPQADWQKVLNEFSLKVGLPALVFSVLSKVEFNFSEYSHLLLANSLFVIFSFLVAYVIVRILRLSPKKARTVFICLPFGNTAFLGIPTLTEVFGPHLLPAASLIVAICVFWVFTIGLGYLNATQVKTKEAVFKKTMMSLIKNPLLISVVLGLVVALLGFPLPKPVVTAIDMLAASVTPVVLVAIGLFIGKGELGKWSDWLPAMGLSGLKLLILPAVFFFAARHLGFQGDAFIASIVQSAMPLAITPFALADEFQLDKSLIARSIELSTVLSVVTIPVWIGLV